MTGNEFSLASTWGKTSSYLISLLISDYANILAKNNPSHTSCRSMKTFPNFLSNLLGSRLLPGSALRWKMKVNTEFLWDASFMDLLLGLRHRAEQRKALSALFCMGELTDARDWLVSLWLTGESVRETFAPCRARAQLVFVLLVKHLQMYRVWVRTSLFRWWCNGQRTRLTFQHSISDLRLKSLRGVTLHIRGVRKSHHASQGPDGFLPHRAIARNGSEWRCESAGDRTPPESPQ